MDWSQRGEKAKVGVGFLGRRSDPSPNYGDGARPSSLARGLGSAVNFPSGVAPAEI